MMLNFSLIEILVIGLLSLLFIITIAYATPLKKTKLFPSELMVRFIPKWNFFAPNPGTIDFYLLYREKNLNNSVSPWIHSNLADYNRTPFQFIWNFRKTGKKALFDLSTSLTHETFETKEDLCKMKMSIPYLLLLTYVSNTTSKLCESFQFVLYLKDPSKEHKELVFNSDWHKK